MPDVPELIVRAADLAEAEGRALRAITVRMALGLAVMLVACGALLGGTALLLAALYIATAERAGPAAGALVTGLVALAIGGTLAWLGHRLAK